MVAFGLGVWRLTTPALWADELATWGAVRLSWGQLLKLEGSVDAVLAPYYAVMKAYAAVAGTSTVALRLPALLAVAGTAAVVFALGKRVGGLWTGVVAGLLFAVTPVVSRYAQEARSYAIVMFFAALAVLCLIRLFERASIPRMLAYAAAAGCAGLFHPLSGLFLLAAHAGAVAWVHFRKQADGWGTTVRWGVAAFAAALPALALAWWASDQTAQVSWIGLVGADVLWAFPAGLFGAAVVGGILIGLALVGVRPGPAFVALAATAFLPVVLMLSVGAITPIWVARYALFVVPAVAVLAGAAATRFGLPQAVAVIVVATVVGWPTQLTNRAPDGHSQDSKNIAAVIGPRYEPGDVAVFPDTHPSISWAARDIYERYLPAPRPPDVLARQPQRHDGKFLATECVNASCLGKPQRIWIIRTDNSADPLAAMSAGKKAAIARSYKPVQRWQSKLLLIVLMERKTK